MIWIIHISEFGHVDLAEINLHSFMDIKSLIDELFDFHFIRLVTVLLITAPLHTKTFPLQDWFVRIIRHLWYFQVLTLMTCNLWLNLTLGAFVSVTRHWECTSADNETEWFLILLDTIDTIPPSDVALLLNLIDKVHDSITVCQEREVAIVYLEITLSQLVHERVLIGEN